MDITAINPALCALLATMTGVEASCVLFENAPRPVHNGRLVLLSWVSGVGVGTDDVAYTYAAAVDPLAEMTPEVAGPRACVLQVSVETYDQRPAGTSRSILENARTRLQSPSALATLKAAGLAFARAESVQTSDYQVDGRWISRCILDVRLNTESRVTDVAGATSYMASVGIVSTITRPDDSASPAQVTGSF